jgi:tetratricopeptide (TPR) repeat protein
MVQAFSAKQYPQALANAQQVLVLDDQNELAYYYKGLSLEGLKRYPEAKQAYEQALSVDGQMIEAHYALGVLSKRMGQTERAKQAFSTFLTLAEAKPSSEQASLKPQTDYVKRQLSVLNATPTTEAPATQP